MAFAIYFEPRMSDKLHKLVRGESISQERYDWIQDNLPKLANDHNEDLTDSQIDYLLSIQATYPSSQKRPAVEPDNAANDHLTHTGIAQGMSQALPAGDRD